MIRMLCVFSFGAAAVLFSASGCDSKKSAPNNPVANEEHHHHHGPNEGELIELEGDGHYHAELLQDVKNGKVTIFLLGEDEKTPVTTAAEAMIIRMTIEKTPVEFSLAAAPKDGETAGNSSKFESIQKELTLALANDKADRELEVKIGDKPYKAKFEYYEPHDHGHAHDEDHKEEPKGEHKDDHQHDEKDAKP